MATAHWCNAECDNEIDQSGKQHVQRRQGKFWDLGFRHVQMRQGNMDKSLGFRVQGSGSSDKQHVQR